MENILQALTRSGRVDEKESKQYLERALKGLEGLPRVNQGLFLLSKPAYSGKEVECHVQVDGEICFTHVEGDQETAYPIRPQYLKLRQCMICAWTLGLQEGLKPSLPCVPH